ncbi:MAG: helical backbone metal receptor [Planctomycetales bacterium]
MRSYAVGALIVVGVFACVYGAKIAWRTQADDSSSSVPDDQATPTNQAKQATPKSPAETPQRIVSMAPGVTETVFALGLGSRLVGVTRYCDHPPEAKQLPQVGGLLDPRYEAVLAAKPDLVLAYPEHVRPKNRFAELRLKTLILKHDTMDEILESLALIGAACGVEERAARLADDMRERIRRIETITRGQARPRTLISLDRDLAARAVQGVYVVGNGGFYEELLEKAGGTNAYQGAAIKFPKLSAEGVLQLNPDVIIDMAGGVQDSGRGLAEVRRDWDSLKTVAAVKTGRVHVFADSHLVRPGPRVVELLEEMAHALHPELEWTPPTSNVGTPKVGTPKVATP